ncbi:MAG: hypothetical protein KGN00_11485 [Chloroflexota bacterium]|nr:hypothetical protein [Chloroflexota bacterium]
MTISRQPGTHPSGPVVLLKYVRSTPSGRPIEATDVLFVRGGVGWVLSLEAAVERWSQTAPLFVEIFQRFRPA